MIIGANFKGVDTFVDLSMLAATSLPLYIALLTWVSVVLYNTVRIRQTKVHRTYLHPGYGFRCAGFKNEKGKKKKMRRKEKYKKKKKNHQSHVCYRNTAKHYFLCTQCNIPCHGSFGKYKTTPIHNYNRNMWIYFQTFIIIYAEKKILSSIY